MLTGTASSRCIDSSPIASHNRLGQLGQSRPRRVLFSCPDAYLLIFRAPTPDFLDSFSAKSMRVFILAQNSRLIFSSGKTSVNGALATPYPKRKKLLLASLASCRKPLARTVHGLTSGVSLAFYALKITIFYEMNREHCYGKTDNSPRNRTHVIPTMPGLAI